jgi:hypothetical protein
MKHRTFRKARVAALASLLVTQGPLIPGGLAAPADPARDTFAAFIDKFWQEAWGNPFIPSRSGLLLQERAPGVFSVQVSDGEGVVAQGTWFEVLRLEEPQLGGLPDLAGTSNLLSLDHAVVAGVLVGSTGAISPAYGMAVTVGLEGPSGRGVFEGFTPFGVADDAQGALAGAYGLHARLDRAQPVLAGGEPPFTQDPCRCQEKLNNEDDACAWRSLACVSACIATAVVAAAACGSLGPFSPVCVAAVITAYLACCAACLANEQACRNDATNNFIDCQEQCLDRNRSPNHGSTGP